MRDHLFTRKPGGAYYFRLQNPPDVAQVLGWKELVKSTGKRDRFEALQIALPEIIRHKKNLVQARHMRDPDNNPARRLPDTCDYAAGEKRFHDDGSRSECSADGQTVVTWDASGRMLPPQPNPAIRRKVYYAPTHEKNEIEALEQMLVKPKRDLDNEILEHWAKTHKHGAVTIVRKFMKTLHEVAPNKCLANLDASDVRAMEARLVAEGNATTSLKTKFGHVSSMVNAAVRHEEFPMMKSNPFKIDDLITGGLKGRRPEGRLFDDDDLSAIADDLKNWPDDLRLFWTVLRSMGPRRSEPTQIFREEKIDGFRCCEYGTKNPMTRRVVPVHPAVLDLLGAKRIDGPLFKHGADYYAKEIKKHIGKIGIAPDSGKTCQSLRAGFETELERKGVAEKYIHTIMGHVPEDLRGNKDGNQSERAKRSISWRYMRGFSPQEIFDAMSLIKTGI